MVAYLLKSFRSVKGLGACAWLFCVLEYELAWFESLIRITMNLEETKVFNYLQWFVILLQAV